MRRYPILVRLTVILLFTILLIYSLIAAKHILYPLALSALFSYLLYPIASFLENKARFPRFLAVLISVLIFLAVITGAINLLINQIQKFAQDDTIKEQAIENFLAIQSFIEGKYQVATDDQNTWILESIRNFFETGGQVKSIIMKAAGTIEAMLFIPIFTFFMLFFRDRAERFAHKLAQKRHSELAEKLIKQISKVTIKYVTGVTTVVIILAIVHSTALSIIGIKYAVVLGIITACFSFIPYFGTIVSGILPLLFTLVAQDNPYLALAVAIYYSIISLIDHNILTPSIVGGKVHLNPFITILSIIIGATIWGIPGMIIVVPFMAVLKIVCDNVESLKPFGYILGVDKHGLSIKKITSFFIGKKEKKKI
ncbi:MAG: AI-2E family transporter [Bacteroidales bacterium]|nr:AI-2E family transporter [Bacteroidales bacterium]